MVQPGGVGLEHQRPPARRHLQTPLGGSAVLGETLPLSSTRFRFERQELWAASPACGPAAAPSDNSGAPSARNDCFVEEWLDLGEPGGDVAFPRSFGMIRQVAAWPPRGGSER